MAAKKSGALVNNTTLLNMPPDKAKDAIKGLTPAKLAKLRADVQCKLNQAQYLSALIEGVLKENSPEYYAAIKQQPFPTSNTNRNSGSYRDNTGPGIDPMEQLATMVDRGSGYSFDNGPIPLPIDNNSEIPLTYDLPA